MNFPLIIGIAGGSGSGKTRFASKLQAELSPERLEIFSLDNYYRPKEEQPLDHEGNENFDTPQSFYIDRIRDDLQRVKSGQDIQVPKYNFNIDRGGDQKKITVNAAPVVVVEGIFTFFFPEVRELLDYKIFVDAPQWLMLKRRIERDELERGYGDLKETLHRYENHVAPAFDKYILPLASKADLIIPNHDNFDTALELLTDFLKSKIA